MKQKLFTLLLAVAASVGITSAAITVRLDSRSCTEWSKVYIWAWTNSGNIFNRWPGQAVSKDAEGWYTYTFASNISSVNIIWSDGNNQTTDITGITASTCYALNSTVGHVGVVELVKLGDLYYNLNATDLTAGVRYGGNDSSSIIIPASITYDAITYSVTCIGSNAFRNCNSLTSVTIPNSVTSIGDYAFQNCSSLTSVTIPNSVTSIGFRAFYDCAGLTSVTIGNSVTYIGDEAFYECSGLTSVTIGNSVTSIGRLAFHGCSSLTSVTIPNSVTSIGYRAFRYCSGLTSVTIGNSVTTIDEGAFEYCSSMISVTIGNSLTSIGSSIFRYCNSLTIVVWNATNCNDFSSNFTPFRGSAWNIRSQIKTFIFGDSVEHIPAYLCVGMENLENLTIGKSITEISADDFSGCNNIKNVTLNSNAIANKNYDSSANLTTVFGTQVEEYIIGEAVTAIGSYAMHNASSLHALTLPSSILSIGQSAFDGCSQLETVNLNSNAIVSKTYTATNNFSTIFGTQVQTYNLGDAITAIGDYAFYNSGNVTSLNIPDGVTTIGNNSFAGCSGVTSLVIPESVTSIGNDAFRECTGVETLTLPNVTTIGNGAFADCNNLTAVQLGNGLISLGDSAFCSCYNLQAIALPSTLKTIGNYAFYQCNRFTAIDIPASITFLGDGAFKGCTKLTTVSINSNAVMSKTYSSISNLSTIFGSQVQSFTLSDAITAIGDYAFYKYTSLPAITIPDNVTAIGEYAFYNCTSLPTITIPSNVTKIGGSAFYGCTGLKSMIIPENITSIENNTFHGCTALSSVNLPNTITSIKDSAFFNCSSLQLESLPSAVSTLGKGAFSGCGSLASIAIPVSLTSVGENAFNDCSGIAEVKIENVDSWCKIDFGNSKSNPVFYSRNLYIGDSLIAELTIPNKITELKPWTFVNCNSINSVFIPNTVRLFSPNAFYDCENITSIEWHAKNIADYASSAASPFYASRSKITSFIFGEETEHIPSHLCSGMNKINLLSFPSYLKSIGDYSFKGLVKIRKINIPNEVTSIGAHAFDSCILVTSIYLGYQVEDIGDYAFKGCIRVNDITCMNTTTPVVYENTLSSISDYAYLYVPAGSKRTYQLDPYWGRFDIREIASEDATLSKDAVTVEANEDNAIFTWPTDSAAASYSLQITKDDVVFCTLVFNSNGQLTGIAFAPSRNGSSHAPAATTSIAGMSFTVTGLNVASKYAYRLAVADDASEELIAYRGEFATTGYDGEVNPGGNPEGIEDVFTDEHKASKILLNGQILILRGEKVYTLQGQEVK